MSQFRKTRRRQRPASDRRYEQLESRTLLHGSPVEITSNFAVDSAFTIPQSRRDDTSVLSETKTSFVSQLTDGSDGMLTLDSDGQIAETIAYIGLATYSNLFNHVYGTELDFPAAEKIS